MNFFIDKIHGKIQVCHSYAYFVSKKDKVHGKIHICYSYAYLVSVKDKIHGKLHVVGGRRIELY